jgi:hypothetical protein
VTRVLSGVTPAVLSNVRLHYGGTGLGQWPDDCANQFIVLWPEGVSARLLRTAACCQQAQPCRLSLAASHVLRVVVVRFVLLALSLGIEGQAEGTSTRG